MQTKHFIIEANPECSLLLSSICALAQTGNARTHKYSNVPPNHRTTQSEHESHLEEAQMVLLNAEHSTQRIYHGCRRMSS